jgi:hypothetical protein
MPPVRNGRSARGSNASALAAEKAPRASSAPGGAEKESPIRNSRWSGCGLKPRPHVKSAVASKKLEVRPLPAPDRPLAWSCFAAGENWCWPHGVPVSASPNMWLRWRRRCSKTRSITSAENRPRRPGDSVCNPPRRCGPVDDRAIQDDVETDYSKRMGVFLEPRRTENNIDSIFYYP